MDEMFFRFLNQYTGTSEAADALIIFGAQYLIFVLFALVGLCALWELKKGNRVFLITIAQVLCAGLLAWGVAHAIKFFVFSPRPFLAMDSVRTLFISGGNDSFPSGHAAFSGALSAALFFSHKKLAFFFALAALVIGFSRVVAGVHFPFDIIGGYLLGAAVGVLTVSFFRKDFKKAGSFDGRF